MRTVSLLMVALMAVQATALAHRSAQREGGLSTPLSSPKLDRLPKSVPKLDRGAVIEHDPIDVGGIRLQVVIADVEDPLSLAGIPTERGIQRSGPAMPA